MSEHENRDAAAPGRQPSEVEEAIFRAIARGTTDALVAMDLDLRYLWVNPKNARWFGKSQGELIGKTAPEVFPERLSALLQQLDREVLETKEPRTCEITTNVQDESRTFITTKSPFFDKAGKTIGIVAISHEITKERRLLEIIEKMSIPVLAIRDKVLLVPLIGPTDASRTADLADRLLAAIRGYRAKVVVIDVTGVSGVTDVFVDRLVGTARAAHLLGARILITGLSVRMAASMVEHSFDLGTIRTVGDPERGIAEALAIVADRH
ncbi:MAG: PAS domain S-box protein [SAR202 cluster bacterium]|nr:PAS domain S-box protein [SAR202 cluster bacterium]